ncbi:MAG: type I-U CRISPR-associated protein Cas7, partial [Planctomycetota bacterium]
GKAAEADIPVVTVDFEEAGLPEVGEVTSLDAPHRLADAILRDSLNNGVKFRESDEGKLLNTASLGNATELYGICPTALVFGLWDSTGPRGGLGTKFQRALVGEVIGVNVSIGVKPSSRIDPLGIEKAGADIYEAADGSGWTIDATKAKKSGGKPVKYGKEGKPSEINHGNVTPSLKNEKNQPHHGGATMDYAQQSVVISLPALRRLRFPDGEGQVTSQRDDAARTALSALAIAAAQLSIDQGCDLRSRCLLIPDTNAPASWEIIGSDGSTTPCTIADATALVNEAAKAAAAAGLPAWKRKPLVLQPSEGLAGLVHKSRELAIAEADEAGD